MSKPLTKKQEGFATDYSLHGDASKAYRDNYECKKASAKSVNELASRLLKNTKVATRVEELELEVAKIAKEKFSVDAEYILKRHIEIDQMDFADILTDDGGLKPPHEWPRIWRTYLSGFDLAEIYDGYGDERQIAGLMKKIKWPDKVKNLEMMGKHKAIKAYIESKEVSGSVDHNHTHVGLSETDRFIAEAVGKGKSRAPAKPLPH
mgnify:CR=1 FL=1